MESLNPVVEVPLACLKVYKAVRTGPKMHESVPKESTSFALLDLFVAN